MLPLLLLVASQTVPCTPSDTTVVCGCKQGRASACEALRQTDSQLADAIEKALQAIKMAAKAQQQAAEAVATEADAASSAPEPPDCKGQKHHIISKPIARVLKGHTTLSGLYKARDPRFIAKAIDEKAHCGYQQWHRDVDSEVLDWLDRHKTATPKEFEEYLQPPRDAREISKWILTLGLRHASSDSMMTCMGATTPRAFRRSPTIGETHPSAPSAGVLSA